MSLPHRSPFLTALLCGVALLTTASAVQANALGEFLEAIAGGEAHLNARLRYEVVDTDSVGTIGSGTAVETAEARTIKTRLTYKTAEYKGFTGIVEFDNVFALFGDTYNSTQNGETGYATVADPEGADLNQAQLRYTRGELSVFGGRQRINFDGQRFVGGVGWRQNEQTYDGAGFNYSVGDRVQLAYAYVYNVNRIFGPVGTNADIEGDHHFVHANVDVAEGHEVSGLYLQLDPEDAPQGAQTTIGVDYRGEVGAFRLHGAFATQSEYGDEATEFSAPYYAGDVTYVDQNFSLGAGIEVLGADTDAGVAFTTPLATLHKFQGWADQFLSTPAAGMQDLFVTGSTKWEKTSFAATYHVFTSAEENTAGDTVDYGTEFDAVLNYEIDPALVASVKVAMYSADEFGFDTNKYWFILTTKL